MNQENEWMLRALEASFYQLGITTPNPPVGAVIVKNGKMLSQGVTQQCGGNHAEICALQAAGSSAEGAELYVTLEPCCHYGKTPPCTEAIIKSGVKRVFVASLDPNPQVSGKGVQQLRSSGIEVVMLSEMESYARQIMLPFFTYITKRRPHIIHKAAFSIDGKIATKTGDSKWISSGLSRYIVHKLRSLVDGIIIGKNTFVHDNPSLSVRFNDFNIPEEKDYSSEGPRFLGNDNLFLKLLCTFRHVSTPVQRQPSRILLGLPDTLDMRANFFYDDNYYIFTSASFYTTISKRSDRKEVERLIDDGKIIVLDSTDTKECNHEVMEYLYAKGMSFLLLEGGSKISASFLEADLISQFLYFITPQIFGEGIPVFQGNGIDRVVDAYKIENITTTLLEQDLVYHGYRATMDTL